MLLNDFNASKRLLAIKVNIFINNNIKGLLVKFMIQHGWSSSYYP